MEAGFLVNLLFILKYQWKCLFGFGDDVEGQERIKSWLKFLKFK